MKKYSLNAFFLILIICSCSQSIRLSNKLISFSTNSSFKIRTEVISKITYQIYQPDFGMCLKAKEHNSSTKEGISISQCNRDDEAQQWYKVSIQLDDETQHYQAFINKKYNQSLSLGNTLQTQELTVTHKPKNFHSYKQILKMYLANPIDNVYKIKNVVGYCIYIKRVFQQDKVRLGSCRDKVANNQFRLRNVN